MKVKKFKVFYKDFSTGREIKSYMTILTINKDMARIKFDEQFGFLYQFIGVQEIV